ncbi:uvrABC system protein C-like [Haliotis cracherodii]|uniref:uvrABC system protein C-like n=1 Tax=Haliotis cracherodii TaxID=6455 RepID=UPI0039EA8352
MGKTSCPINILLGSIMLLEKSLPWTSRPPPGVPGIYAIKKGKKVIYVGRSKNIRKRLTQHFSGKSQPVDKFLRGKTKRYKNQHIKLAWLKDKKQRCNEHCYIKGVKQLQKKHPVYNMKPGSSC